jgi:hypothetical protein
MGKNIFSEDRGVVDDAFMNAGDAVDDARTGLHENVKESIHPGGVLYMGDCPYCGLQWKSVIKWPEIMGLFLGQVVPNTATGPAGVGLQFGCKKCGRVTNMTTSWDAIENYVGRGVKMNVLPQDIFRARDQIRAERAKGQVRR